MLSRRHFLRTISGLGVAGISTVANGVGEPELQLQVTRYQLSPPRWPADFKLKIAVVADVHACDPWMSLDRIQSIVEHTNTLGADITVLLGDYVAGHRHVTRFIPADEWAAVLAGLKAPLGVHAILVYENDAQRLSKDGRPFWLAGLGDQLAYLMARRYRFVRRIGVDDLGATLNKVTDDAPVILLAHEPDVAVRVPSRVALQLSGHTHGGQVRLLGWSPISPSGQRLAYGHVRMNCDVVVSGGLGCSILPFRLGVPPEIVLVTLGEGGPVLS
jgi:uncharacterized protein